jgi:two-component system sensor histidine kinase/response regulator
LSAFTQDVQKLLSELPKSLPAHTDQTLNRTLHTLKGLAATVGANTLVTVTNEIYQKFKEGSLSHKQWPKYHRALKAKGLDAIASAQRFLKETVPESKESPLLINKLHLFKKLIPYLESNNMKALELYAELKQRVGIDKALDAAINRLDFKTATSRCKLLITQPIEGNS